MKDEETVGIKMVSTVFFLPQNVGKTLVWSLYNLENNYKNFLSI